MKKTLIIVLVTILVVFFGVSGFFAFRQEVPKSKVGAVQTFDFNPLPNSNGINDITLVMSGGTLDLAPTKFQATLVNVQTNIEEWHPIENNDKGLVIEQANRPKDNWQPMDYVLNKWKIEVDQTPVDLKLDAHIWNGTIDLTGLNLHSFQLADLNSQSVIRFDKPAVLFDTFVIDSIRSNMKVNGLLNSGARNVILRIPFGNYFLDFTGDQQQNMSAVITTGFGKTRIEISDSANVQVTYTGQTRKSTIEGEWILVEGTTYVHENPGYLLDIVINSDQGDLEVVLVK